MSAFRDGMSFFVARVMRVLFIGEMPRGEK